MVNYADKEIYCKYKNMDACRNDYTNHHVAVCFPRKSLNLDGDKK